MYGNFFPNLSPIIAEKCVVTPNFLPGPRQPLPRSASFTQSQTAQKYCCVSGQIPQETRISRDAQNVCAVTKGGTILKCCFYKEIPDLQTFNF